MTDSKVAQCWHLTIYQHELEVEIDRRPDIEWEPLIKWLKHEQETFDVDEFCKELAADSET